MPFAPDMADDLASPVVEVYAEAERLLLARIARHLQAGIDAPDWAERKLLEVQLLQRYTAAEMVGANAVATATMAAQASRAWNRGTAVAESDIARSVLGGLRAAVPVQPRLEAIIGETTDSLRKVSQAVLRVVPDEFRAVIRAAAPQVLTGLQTTRQAAQAALDQLAARGLTGFTDGRGRQWGLDTYVEMATRTAVGRAAIDGHTSRLQGRGFQLVMVSDAPQECSLCRPFEGKVFALNEGSLGEHATMTLDQARDAGLFHPNCRHSTALYQPGITRLPDHTADPVGDAARQRLRYLERRVRAAKRREAVALDPDARKRARADVRREQARIRDHVATTPAKRRPDREQLREPRPLQVQPFARDTDEELQGRLMREFERDTGPDEQLVERISVEMDMREKYAGTDLSEHYRRRNTALDEGFAGQSDEEITELIEQAVASGDPEAAGFVHEAHLELNARTYAGKNVHRAVKAARRAAPRGETKASKLRRAREDYDLWLQTKRLELENYTNGNLIRRDRLAEWNTKHGGRSQLDMMLEGDPVTAFRYASEEVRRFWEGQPRYTFAEWAVQAGVQDAALEERARKAKGRLRDAMTRGEERDKPRRRR